MYPYPPWHFDAGWWLCAAILPAAFIVIAVVISRSSVSARKATYPVIALLVVWILFTTVVAPSMGQARPTAQRVHCAENLRNIATAIHSFHDQHGRLPPPHVETDGAPPTTWRIDLVPYFSGQGSGSSLTGDYQRDLTWDDSANLPVAQRENGIYWCPANASPQDSQLRWYSAYALLTGPGTAFPAEQPLKIDELTDGASRTLLAVEACGRNIVWTEPRDVDVSREQIGVNVRGTESGTSNGILSSYHGIEPNGRTGANCAFADGHVGFMSAEIDPDVLRKLTTAAGSEAISNDDF